MGTIRIGRLSDDGAAAAAGGAGPAEGGELGGVAPDRVHELRRHLLHAERPGIYRLCPGEVQLQRLVWRQIFESDRDHPLALAGRPLDLVGHVDRFV